MIDPGAKVDPNYFVYKSGTENDIWVKTADGKDFNGDAWPGAAAFPDFTYPKANKWWQNLYKDFLAQGVDGVWNDVNEPQINDTPNKTMPDLKTSVHPDSFQFLGGPALCRHMDWR